MVVGLKLGVLYRPKMGKLNLMEQAVGVLGEEARVSARAAPSPNKKPEQLIGPRNRVRIVQDRAKE
jgi:hypothetical protein